MSTAVYEQLLTNKRQQMFHHYSEYLRLKQEADELDATLERGETPTLPGGPEFDDRFLSREKKSELRMAKVLALFQRKKANGGIVFVEDVMRECKISKTPAKEWMNSRIDMDPDSCPWERVDGIKTMFVLKSTFMQQAADSRQSMVRRLMRRLPRMGGGR